MAAGPSPPTRAGEPAARRARHPFRTILKVLAWFIGSILLLLTIAFGLLQTELGRGWVKDLVLGVLNDNFKGSFECAHIGGFLPFHATVEGFVIKDPEGNLVLSVAKVDADFAPLGLLDQKVRLSDIHVTQPVVNIFDDKNRVMFVRAFEPKVPSPPTEAPPWEVELEGIVLDQGLVAGLVPGQDLALEDIRVGLTLSVGMNGPSWRDLAVTAVPRGGSELALALRGGPVSLRSSGSLDGDMLHVDHLDFDGGPHHASASAQLYLPDLSPGAALGAPAHTPSTVELTRLHVEIAALPPPVRDFLGPGFVDAAGRGTLSRGEANVHASLLTPLGFVGVQVGGTVLPRLGEYAGTLWTFDTVIPAGLRERLPPAIQAARVDLALDFHGRGNPLLPAGDFVAEGDVWQRAPADSGHLELAFQRLHEDLSAPHGEGELAPPASFSLRVVGDAFGLQPWLGTAGQPDLAGELHGLWAEGTLSLPSASQPLSLSAMFAFDGAVRGLLATGATSQPLALSRVAAQGTMTWDGRRAPVGHVELDADGVAAEAATAGSLATALDLELDGDGHLHARGTLRAVDLERLDLHAAAVDVPFDLTLVDGLPTGDIGGIIVSGRYGAHEIDRAETSLHVVREGSGLRVYGDVALNGLAVDHGAERVGDAELAIDLRLAATDPLDPMVVPSHGTVRGTLANVRAGPRSARQLDVDLRVDAYHGLGGPLALAGTVGGRAIASPEATVARADARVNLTLRGADVQGSATIDASDALVLVLPPAGGRRFNTVHVEARTLGGAGQLEVSGNASEAGLLDSRFMAHLSLPRGRRPFTATLDELRMHRAPVAGGRRDPTDLVVITGARLDETGWIDFGTIHVGTSATGSLSLSGRLQAKDGELDLTASGKDIRLDDWLGHVRRLTRLPLDNLPDADGVVSFEIVATGTAAEPRVRAEVHLRDARFDQRQGGAVDLDAALSGSAFKGTYAVRWSAEGHAEGSFDLPVDVSFDPFRARFDETAPVAFELAAAVPDLRDALAWGEAVVGHALLPGFSGKTTVTASLGGTGLAPKVSLRAAPLAIAQAPGTTPTARCKKGCDWKGAIALEGNTDPHDPRHWRIGLTVDEGVVAKAPPAPKPGTVAAPAAVDPNAPSPASGMVPGAPPPGVAPTATTPVVNAADADADENRLLRLEADVPTTVFAAIWSSDPGAVERILAAEDLGLALNMPERALGDLPGVALIEDFAYRGVHVRANLRFNGRYPKLVADGLVRLTELGDLGLSGGLEARFTSDGDKLIVMVDASASELSLASGQITIPKFGTLLTAPGRFRDLLEEPDFKIQLDTMALPTADLINLDPSLGQTLEMLFPYSTASAHVTAHGERGGPEANIVLAIFATGSDASSNDPSAAATASAATALAEQTYVTLKVRRVETELDAILVGDTRRGTGLSLTARADVGTTALLQGKVENWGRIPITATLVADTFRLEGLMSAFQEILGGTAGFMTGTLDIDGTLGEPRFNGTPGIVLEPLSVPKIGFEQPASLYIAFEGSSIRLQDPLVFEVPAKKGDEAQTMQLDFHADVPNFDPKRITLDGSLTLLRYPVLATQDMQVRATGRATLTGTAARPVIEGKIAVVDGVVAPDIAQRDVRALGLPADVHFVRGEAKPPPDVAKRVTSRKTAMQIDLAIDIPKSSVRVEPHIVQPIGEVRALLWPYGSLQIRTVQREIGIFGTIYVPKENVYLYGKKFVVDPDSRVVFTGDMETDPQLFLTARYDISHVDLTSIGLSTTAESEVVVRVSGSPSTNLRIDFASDPPMDEANILSVIALDQPAGGGQGITDAVTTQIAGAVLGMATLELTRDLVKKLPIDILRIESTSASLESAKVTVGKILAQDLTWYNFFNVNAREGESVYESSLEYRLNRYFSLIAKWGDIGELSLETSLRFQP